MSRDGQVGGTHYKVMAIQPFEMGHANGYDNEAFSIIKYLSRHKSKGGIVDLRKSIHIAQIRRDLTAQYGPPVRPCSRISMAQYCLANEIPSEEATALFTLDAWCRNTGNFDTRYNNGGDAAYCDALIAQITAIAELRYLDETL